MSFIDLYMKSTGLWTASACVFKCASADGFFRAIRGLMAKTLGPEPKPQVPAKTRSPTAQVFPNVWELITKHLCFLVPSVVKANIYPRGQEGTQRLDAWHPALSYSD